PASSADAGQVFIGGYTYSTDFPGVANGAQSASGGGVDGFIARLAPDLRSLGGATYLGGSGADNVEALAFDGASTIYAAGKTTSSNFPCAAPDGPAPAGGGKCAQQHAGAQSNYGGGLSDGFVALFDTTLGTLTQSSYFGGNSFDSIAGVSVAPASSTFAGDVVVGGTTTSANLAGTAGAAQTVYAGSGDAFAAAIAPNLQGPQVTLNVAVNGPASVDTGNNFTMTVVVTNDSQSGSTAATNVSIADTISSPTSTATATYVSSQTTQGTCKNNSGFLTCELGNLVAGGGSATITITATAGNTAGDSTSNVTVFADQALSAGSTSKVAHDTNITKPSSSGGGAFGWPALLLLVVLALGGSIRRQRKFAQERV
ncbi:MAG: SBBP repeat-containing protein, partial [Gammaproteobacteria bacterium]